MNTAIERLLTLRVKDIMRNDVLVIRESDRMSDAAQTLSDAEVTGAPVVDAAGRCTGILSASDFVGRDAGTNCTGPLLASEHGGYQVDLAHDELVSTHMSPVVQTVSSETPIMQAARILCQEHIHRLVVIDPEQRPIGLASSLDFVAAMVAAIEE